MTFCLTELSPSASSTSDDAEVCATTNQSDSYQPSESDTHEDVSLSLLCSPFEPVNMRSLHALPGDNSVVDHEAPSSMMSCECHDYCNLNSTVATDMAFESPSEQYSAFPHLIHDIQVSYVDPSWEKGGGFSTVRKAVYRAKEGNRPVAVKQVKHSSNSLATRSTRALENELQVSTVCSEHLRFSTY